MGTLVANCLCGHVSFVLVFIPLVASQLTLIVCQSSTFIILYVVASVMKVATNELDAIRDISQIYYFSVLRSFFVIATANK